MQPSVFICGGFQRTRTGGPRFAKLKKVLAK